jgi:hypothetical protein
MNQAETVFQNMMCMFWMWIAFGGVGYVLGKYAKGRPEMGAILGFLLGPIGWLLTIAFDDARKRCPACRGVLIAGATKCRHCGTSLVLDPPITRPPVPPSSR